MQNCVSGFFYALGLICCTAFQCFGLKWMITCQKTARDEGAIFSVSGQV